MLLAAALRAEIGGASELHWTVSAVPREAKAGDEIELHFVADIPEGVIVYSSDFTAALGPRPARFSFDANDAIELTEGVRAVQSKRRSDKTFGTEYSYFVGRAEFVQKARLLKDSAHVQGRIKGQTCREKDGVCTLFEEPFTIELR
jgi:hypothetical protein